MNICNLVMRQAGLRPDAIAVCTPDGCITYGVLDRLTQSFTDMLYAKGVLPGERIGIWLDKSIYAVIAMQGALRARAIYVPLDPLSPGARITTIIHQSAMSLLVTVNARLTLLPDSVVVPSFLWDKQGEELLFARSETTPWSENEITSDEGEIAYILYTSGSTGVPKGVCISHENALAFIMWAAQEVKITPSDRLANHAPFHFDLSVFDLYAAFFAGACVSFIPDGKSYIPLHLVEFLRHEAITIWYSVPSVLILMQEQGAWLNGQGDQLRALLFAGEPFPIKYFRRVYEHYAGKVRFLNLYGPTETNVCSFYEIFEHAQCEVDALPIGQACSGDRIWAQKEDGEIAYVEEVGELMVVGPTVMVGYWGNPPHGSGAYATGDLVRLQEDGNYRYIGRRDHMIKVRGYRIELGEIEHALLEHLALQEVAVIVGGTGLGARIVAFAVAHSDKDRPTLLALKRHCSERVPRYMIIDTVQYLLTLPRTRNGKIDRLQLSQHLSSSS